MSMYCNDCVACALCVSVNASTWIERRSKEACIRRMEEGRKERNNIHTHARILLTVYLLLVVVLLLLLPLLLNKRLNSRSSHDSRYLVYVLCVCSAFRHTTQNTRWCCNRPSYHTHTKILNTFIALARSHICLLTHTLSLPFFCRIR